MATARPRGLITRARGYVDHAHSLLLTNHTPTIISSECCDCVGPCVCVSLPHWIGVVLLILKSMSRVNSRDEFDRLCRMISRWNDKRVELFEISMPNEVSISKSKPF